MWGCMQTDAELGVTCASQGGDRGGPKSLPPQQKIRSTAPIIPRNKILFRSSRGQNCSPGIQNFSPTRRGKILATSGKPRSGPDRVKTPRFGLGLVENCMARIFCGGGKDFGPSRWCKVLDSGKQGCGVGGQVFGSREEWQGFCPTGASPLAHPTLLCRCHARVQILLRTCCYTHIRTGRVESGCAVRCPFV